MQLDPHLVGITVWNAHEQVVYSVDPKQIGRRFPSVGDLVGHGALLVTYIPIRRGSGVIGAYKAESNLGALTPRLDGMRRTIWGALRPGSCCSMRRSSPS